MFPWAQELGNATQAGIFENGSEQKSTLDFFAKEVFGPKTIGQQMFRPPSKETNRKKSIKNERK
jgi:hypothetical protein